MKLDDHPTVQLLRRTSPEQSFPVSTSTLDAVWLRTICLDAGAADVGFVELGRPALADQRDDILRIFPRAQSFISFVVRMNREPIRSPARSVANLEFHHAGDRVNDIARTIVEALEARGVRALNPSMGFPMEMDRFPGKIWVISHKPVAVQADSARWAFTETSFIPSLAVSCSWVPSSWMPRSAPTMPRSHTTLAWNASSAWRPARPAPSAPTAISTSPPATRTTIESSWEASQTGSSRSRTVRMPDSTGRKSPTLNQHPCGKACRSAPTTRPPTAWRYARPVKM